MHLETTPIPGLLVLRLDLHEDDRGWFQENWQREKMVALGLPDFEPVQHNLAYNARRGTTRGVHQGVEPSASFSITPPNSGTGGGSCLPSSVTVASGAPGVPWICCAKAGAAASANDSAPAAIPMMAVPCMKVPLVAKSPG